MTGGRHLVADAQIGLGVDDLFPALQLPRPSPAFGLRTRRVAAAFHPVRDSAAVLAVQQPFRRLTAGARRSINCASVTASGLPSASSTSASSVSSGALLAMDDVPERRRLWRWRLGIEVRQIELGQIRRHVADAAVRYHPQSLFQYSGVNSSFVRWDQAT